MPYLACDSSTSQGAALCVLNTPRCSPLRPQHPKVMPSFSRGQEQSVPKGFMLKPVTMPSAFARGSKAFRWHSLRPIRHSVRTEEEYRVIDATESSRLARSAARRNRAMARLSLMIRRFVFFSNNSARDKTNQGRSVMEPDSYAWGGIGYVEVSWSPKELPTNDGMLLL